MERGAGTRKGRGTGGIRESDTGRSRGRSTGGKGRTKRAGGGVI